MNRSPATAFRNFFKRQELNDHESQAAYRLLHPILIISLLGGLGTLAAVFTFEATRQAQNIVIGMNALLLVSYVLFRQRILSPARVMAPLSLLISVLFIMLTGSGIHDIAIVALGGVIILASLTLGRRASFVFAALMIAAIFGMALAEIYGLLVTDASQLATIDDPFVISIVILAIALTQNVLINRLNLSVQEARQNEKLQTESNRELTDLKNALERRITERTSDLERRASQMEIIASIARSITAMQDVELLLPFICRVVSEQFGFYHTGIFLLDERAEYAVLRAANSEGGQRMLARGHRLRVGTSGIVGVTAAQGEARIALDVGADAVYFNNPDLPDTRSEMSLPLKVGGQTIGILDVQSREMDAFNEEDVAVLGILANQISVAIQNTRLFSQTTQALAEAQAIQQQYVIGDWERFSRAAKNRGYAYNGLRVAPLENGATVPAIGSVNLPIKIRGLTIGSVTLQSPNPSRQWTQDEINLAQAAAERAGLAIENYRLLTEAQRRAAKERAISAITGRIGASADMREIMRTAVEELGRVLPGSEVAVQFDENF